jgi:hypothetical protein
VNTKLATALALTENARLDPEAVSSINTNGTVDVGLFQLNSAYIDSFVSRYWDKGGAFNWKDPYHNAYVGLKHFRYLMDKANWGPWQALIAWNAGETALMTGKPPDSAIEFAGSVYRLMVEMQYTEQPIFKKEE